MKFKIIFTLDYEIHGNGEGSPLSLMVEPTRRILNLFAHYGAKLTIMADIAAILKFKEYSEHCGGDDYYYKNIIEQLTGVVKAGHDVQLHLHSGYFNASFENGYWHLNYLESNLAQLDYKRIFEFIKIGKVYLEELLNQKEYSYKCFVFRAANWLMSPSSHIVKALIENGIKIDTSVFKYGKRKGIAGFDYTHAFSDLIPWSVDENDICKKDINGKLFEFPIYCEKKPVWAFITPNRIFRVIQATKHPPHKGLMVKKKQKISLRQSIFHKYCSFLTSKHAWKMDFNQCTGRQLIGALKRIRKKYGHFKCDLPVVLIGHSKIFNLINEKSLIPFLKFVKKNSDLYAFSTFRDFNKKTSIE